jgi:hypothetical protein
MNDLDATTRGTAVSYRCSSCSRRFIDFGEAGAGELVCACSAPLSPHALPCGLYELGAAMSEETRATTPGRAPIPKEPDGGYGASHGYDVTHGGPTGPGDAPADVPDEAT